MTTDKTIKQIESTSQTFHEQATLLSEKLAQVEERLNAMKGKVQCAVGTGTVNDPGLMWQRDGKTYALFIWTNDAREPEIKVSEAKLRHKIIAAKLLHQLLDAILAEQKTELQAVQEAIQRIDALKI